ncbi:hypothetical protein [Mucilaginibacter sp. R-33]
MTNENINAPMPGLLNKGILLKMDILSKFIFTTIRVQKDGIAQ